MTIRGIITVLVLAILFGLVVVWISKQGGWKAVLLVSICQRSSRGEVFMIGSLQSPILKIPTVVENNGFEPLTPCLQSRCSSQLS